MEKMEGLAGSLLTQALSELIENVQETFKNLLTYQTKHIYLVANNLLELWFVFTKRALHDSDKLVHAQLIYWQDYLLLCQDLQRRLADNPDVSDVNESKNIILMVFMEKFYFLLSQHVQLVIKNLCIEAGEEDTQKLEYYNRLFAEALLHAPIHPDAFSVSSAS